MRANFQELEEDHAKLQRSSEEIAYKHNEFMALADREAQHIRELIIANIKRLQVLEMQQAQMGLGTGPSILMEIQDIRTAVERLRRKIRDIGPHTDRLIRQIIEE